MRHVCHCTISMPAPGVCVLLESIADSLGRQNIFTERGVLYLVLEAKIKEEGRTAKLCECRLLSLPTSPTALKVRVEPKNEVKLT